MKISALFKRLYQPEKKLAFLQIQSSNFTLQIALFKFYLQTAFFKSYLQTAATL